MMIALTCNMSPTNSFLANSKYQVTIPTAIAAAPAPRRANILPHKYEAGPNDVVCGRGKGSYNRPGNKKFRALVQEYVPRYVNARTKLDKSMVLSAIVEKVREENGGRFIKQRKGGEWYEIGDEQAREKVGHAIREAIAAGEKKSQAAPPSPKQQGETPMEFQSKQTDLLSTQLSIFEGLVARSNSPVEASNQTDPQSLGTFQW